MRLVASLPMDRVGNAIGSQLIRAGTSVGANYRAACRARSKTEFCAKMGIVLEEVDESVFWLELIVDGGLMEATRLQELMREGEELTAMTVASLNTAKNAG